jgi:hypothetical protein
MNRSKLIFGVDFNKCFKNLKKGDFIPAEICEKHISCRRDDPKYTNFLTRMKKKIEKEILPNTAIKVEDKGLRILTDREAVIYYDTRIKRDVKNVVKNTIKSQNNIDIKKLNKSEKQEYTKLLMKQKMIASTLLATSLSQKYITSDDITFKPLIRELNA